jgi:ribosomal-protein-alanine N-acetyltransferase
LNKYLAHWEQHGFGRWALIERQSKKLIGWCGLLYLDNTEEVEIGYGLAKVYWGKGLASEAAADTMKYGFEQLALARIVAITYPENLASQRVLEKLGMKYVMQARFYNTDVRYYAISRDEYRASLSSEIK